MNYIIVDDELYHWRTKESKNGIRRYQFKDGTYTEEGKARRRKGNGHHFKVEKKYKVPKNLSDKEVSNQTKTAGQILVQRKIANTAFSDAQNTTTGIKRLVERVPDKKQDLSGMTNQELQRYITRVNLERQYNSITNQEKNQGKRRRLEILDVAGDVLSVAGSATALALSIIALKRGG